METSSQQHSTKARFAIRRLYKDWKELEHEKSNLPTVTALPTSDIFVWHCNLRPDSGPFASTIFHLILTFPQDYPHSPPDVELCTHLPHPNVFWRYPEGYWLCLDMIQEYYTAAPYVGWTSAYSLVSVLLQLQSFLFAENIPQNTYSGADYGAVYTKANRSKHSIYNAISAARRFWIDIETHDGMWVRHSYSDPWPPLPAYKGEPGISVPRPADNGHKGDTKMNLLTRGTNQNGALSPQHQAEFQYRAGDFPALGEEENKEVVVSVESSSASLSSTETSMTAETSIPSCGLAETNMTVAKSPAGGCSPLTTGASPSPKVDIQQVENLLPSEVYTHVFSFLDAKELLRVRDVCSHWRRVVYTFNLFERTQIMCFHSKAKLGDKDTILGVGLKVEYYPSGDALKSVSSPLDILSLQAFQEEGVRTGVWGGAKDAFDHFLPLIFDSGHAAMAVETIEQCFFNIMKNCRLFPNGPCHHSRFHPMMVIKVLAVLMNSMVVELMKKADQRGGKPRRSQTSDIRRHASEKALEGYCAFHHMLLFFAKRYPTLIQWADQQVGLFLSCEYRRHKRCAPNLGVLLVCLTLSRRGWDRLCKPLVMEAFDRNVRWLLQKHPCLADPSLPSDERFRKTFMGARTSLRLLMFQVYFMSHIGRPANTKGPFDVLAKYDKRLGKPTTAQKEDLQRNAKEILAVDDWTQFFLRLGGAAPFPTRTRLDEILKQAVRNSERKRYHYPAGR